MRETGQSSSPEDDDRQEFGRDSADYDHEDDVPGFDWIVFILRAAALVTLGATLVTAVDLSQNQDAVWLTVMRFSILPFAAGMLVLAAGELIDRSGD